MNYLIWQEWNQDHFNLSDEEVEIEPFLNRIHRKFQGLAKEKNIAFSL